MATWITIATGIVVGLLCRRFSAAHPPGTFTDILLGITGAFAARWFLDVLQLIGANLESYRWVFVLCGAALVPWSFHRLRRWEQIHHPQYQSKTRKVVTDSSRQADPRKTRAPAA